MFQRGGGVGVRRCLTRSLHLKFYISCSTWPDILWLFRPDIMCSCQYCLVRYRPICIVCFDYPTIVVSYNSENIWSMLILCWASAVDGWNTSIQHCQSYTINTIGLHQLNVFLMLDLHRKQWPTLNQYWVSVSCWLRHQQERWPSAGFTHNLRYSPNIKHRVVATITVHILLVYLSYTNYLDSRL